MQRQDNTNNENIEIPYVVLINEQKTEAPTQSSLEAGPLQSPAYESNLVPIQQPTPIHPNYSQGLIINLLARERAEEKPSPQEIATVQAMQDEARCDMPRARNAMRGTSIGLGFGWLSGASLMATLGYGCFFGICLTFFNPRMPAACDNFPFVSLPRLRLP